jgi:catechol 2,3-dioxygenase-like lactoylglutathione lyase family enzyme
VLTYAGVCTRIEIVGSDFINVAQRISSGGARLHFRRRRSDLAIRMGHLAITVGDMEKSLDFYTKGFGFKQSFELARPETGEPWIVYLYMGNGQFVELFYGGKNPYKWDVADRAYNHVCFAVDDIREAAARLEAAGYPLDKQPKVGCDGNWQCWITDPDGVRIEIMQLAAGSPQMNAMTDQ